MILLFWSPEKKYHIVKEVKLAEGKATSHCGKESDSFEQRNIPHTGLMCEKCLY